MRKVDVRSIQRHFATKNDLNIADRDTGTMRTRGAAASFLFEKGQGGSSAFPLKIKKI